MPFSASSGLVALIPSSSSSPFATQLSPSLAATAANFSQVSSACAVDYPSSFPPGQIQPGAGPAARASPVGTSEQIFPFSSSAADCRPASDSSCRLLQPQTVVPLPSSSAPLWQRHSPAHLRFFSPPSPPPSRPSASPKPEWDTSKMTASSVMTDDEEPERKDGAQSTFESSQPGSNPSTAPLPPISRLANQSTGSSDSHYSQLSSVSRQPRPSSAFPVTGQTHPHSRLHSPLPSQHLLRLPKPVTLSTPSSFRRPQSASASIDSNSAGQSAAVSESVSGGSSPSINGAGLDGGRLPPIGNMQITGTTPSAPAPHLGQKSPSQNAGQVPSLQDMRQLPHLSKTAGPLPRPDDTFPGQRREYPDHHKGAYDYHDREKDGADQARPFPKVHGVVSRAIRAYYNQPHYQNPSSPPSQQQQQQHQPQQQHHQHQQPPHSELQSQQHHKQPQHYQQEIPLPESHGQHYQAQSHPPALLPPVGPSMPFQPARREGHGHVVEEAVEMAPLDIPQTLNGMASLGRLLLSTEQTISQYLLVEDAGHEFDDRCLRLRAAIPEPQMAGLLHQTRMAHESLGGLFQLIHRRAQVREQGMIAPAQPAYVTPSQAHYRRDDRGPSTLHPNPPAYQGQLLPQPVGPNMSGAGPLLAPAHFQAQHYHPGQGPSSAPLVASHPTAMAISASTTGRRPTKKQQLIAASSSPLQDLQSGVGSLPGTATTGVKKKRGRLPPPPRCLNCNRQDTPEWRRGPDGARTLCNACGLHYAKASRRQEPFRTAGQSSQSQGQSPARPAGPGVVGSVTPPVATPSTGSHPGPPSRGRAASRSRSRARTTPVLALSKVLAESELESALEPPAG